MSVDSVCDSSGVSGGTSARYRYTPPTRQLHTRKGVKTIYECFPAPTVFANKGGWVRTSLHTSAPVGRVCFWTVIRFASVLDSLWILY